MKTKHTFYFLLILIGALLLATGDKLLRREYAMSLGVCLLMLGIYKVSQGWNQSQSGGDNSENG